MRERVWTSIKNHWRETVLLIAIMTISGVAHGYNILHYPFFEEDEGTYVAQAWSFLTKGKLAPYTYWYDHAPFGWIFTALWLFLTGGLFTFGFSLNSGRVLMLVIHLFSTYFLYQISKTITRSRQATFLTCMLFSLSPLAIYFQRRLLLDNLMTFWVLLSLFLIFSPKKRMTKFFCSAVAFGVAVLTKENAAFFFPVFVWLVFHEAHRHHRGFVVAKWVGVVGIIVSAYPLYAVLKQELFPEGSIFSPPWNHVSLLGTLKMQASRGAGLPFWEPGSDFMGSFRDWYGRDTFLMLLGLSTFLIHGFVALFSWKNRVVFLLTIPTLLFLVSGKLVLNFYVVPIIPFLALCIGLFVSQLGRVLNKLLRPLGLLTTAMVMLVFGLYYSYHIQRAFFRNETSKQVEAIEWIKRNISPSKNIVVGFFGYSDLTESRFPGDPKFTSADWFWKVEADPEIREEKLKGKPENIDYVLVTAEIQRQLKGFDERTSMLRNALAHSTKMAQFSFEKDFDFQLDLPNQQYPNGDWVVIYKQENALDLLSEAWNTYKRTFIRPDGRVIDLSTSRTTSEGQSYAMLRAVWSRDQRTFNNVWSWTRSHLQRSDGVFAWLWGIDGQLQERVLDRGSASDADSDIALSLLLASKRWRNPIYAKEAMRVVDGIWNSEIKVVDETPYLVAGDWAKEKDELVINPSYLSPYAYRIFAEVDTDHPWNLVVDSSYLILDRCITGKLDKEISVPLPPNWCVFDADGEAIIPKEEGLDSTDYSFDAVRTTWRIGVDYAWNRDERAEDLLRRIGDFLVQKVQTEQKILVGYTHDGLPKENYESPFSYAVNLPAIGLVNPTMASQIYNENIRRTTRYDSAAPISTYWEDAGNYYVQNWTWFGTALYTENLPNLWRSQ